MLSKSSTLAILSQKKKKKNPQLIRICYAPPFLPLNPNSVIELTRIQPICFLTRRVYIIYLFLLFVLLCNQLVLLLILRASAFSFSINNVPIVFIYVLYQFRRSFEQSKSTESFYNRYTLIYQVFPLSNLYLYNLEFISQSIVLAFLDLQMWYTIPVNTRCQKNIRWLLWTEILSWWEYPLLMSNNIHLHLIMTLDAKSMPNRCGNTRLKQILENYYY